MNWLVIILSLIAFLSLLRLWMYKLHLRDLNKQLRFMTEYETNMLLTSQINSKNWNNMHVLINTLITEQHSIKQLYQHNEQTFRNTLTDLSHDIRTPLTSLDGYFQILVKEKDPAKRRYYENIIQGRIYVLKEMLEAIFMYTKLQNETYELNIEKVQLNSILIDTIFSFYQEMEEQHLKPRITITETPIFIEGNKEALHRIFSNLINNALIHGKDRLEITLSQKNETIQLVFANNIPSKYKVDINKVFDRFYMSDSSRNNNSTGLGLFITKELTTKMQGDVSAELEDGVFRMNLTFTASQMEKS